MLSQNNVVSVNMDESVIKWNEEQKQILETLKRYRRDSDLKEWSEHGLEQSNEIRQILEEADFQNKDLSSHQLEQIFSIMRNVISNRALTRNLYEKNGINDFNEALRQLLDESIPLSARIDDFLDLSGVGKFTVSHFLFLYNPRKFPILSRSMEQILEIEARQKQTLENRARKKYEINETEISFDWTTDILSNFILYDALKAELQVDDFIFLNGIFWKESKRDPDEEEPPFVTVSLEKDLRRYLADNSTIIEEGMELVEEEYNTAEAGIIDLLCKDDEGRHVVVETKKGRSSDAVVGQILRYIGWVHNNLDDKVRGIIIVSDPDPRLDNALVTVPHVEIKYYRVRFEISDTPF